MMMNEPPKPPLNIGFADTGSRQFWIDLLSQKYELLLGDPNPQYLIFGDANFGQSNRQFSRSNTVKIFYTGENQRADNYDCDYAIDFDYRDEPWHYRFPGYAAVPYWYSNYPQDTILHTQEYLKKDFCLFVHRNGGCPERNQFFHMLNQYKKVDAVGPLFHNVDFSIGSEYNEKIELAKSYKFVLAFENGSHPGYVTEKIMDGFYAGAIPIYWGSYKIHEDFNSRSFVNVHNWTGINNNSIEAFQGVIDRIKLIDQNPDLYNQYIDQPKLIGNKLNECMKYENLLNWFHENVYMQKNRRPM
jgi:hypothetical protein